VRNGLVVNPMDCQSRGHQF